MKNNVLYLQNKLSQKQKAYQQHVASQSMMQYEIRDQIQKLEAQLKEQTDRLARQMKRQEITKMKANQTSLF